MVKSDLIQVLIVDDEPLIRMDLREMLEESLVYEVLGEARDGQEAVDFVMNEEKQSPDVIFMDIRMPNKTGLEAAKEITEYAAKRIPIIMLTAHSQSDLYEEASRVGVFAYLTKPLRKQDLAPAIEITLARSIELQELSSEISSLKDKLETRKIVERAKGLLMSKFQLEEPEAYRKLQKEAMNKRSSIKDVAEVVLSSLSK